MIRCTCCNAELTAPQFYNGFPYGFTCIKKVDPSFKRTKVNYVLCDSFKIVQGEGTQRITVKVACKDKVKTVVVYGDLNGRTTNTFMQDGSLYISESVVK